MRQSKTWTCTCVGGKREDCPAHRLSTDPAPAAGGGDTRDGQVVCTCPTDESHLIGTDRRCPVHGWVATAARPVGVADTDTLREEIAGVIGKFGGVIWNPTEAADAVLALPAVRGLTDKLAAVEELTAELEDRGVKAIVEGHYWPEDSARRSQCAGKASAYRVAADEIRATLRRALGGLR